MSGSIRQRESGLDRRGARGFTCIELVMIVLVAAVLIAVLVPGTRRVRLAGVLTQSTANVRQLLIAAVRYRLDHAGQMPMRGAQYTSGMLGGWDVWNFAGKNCNVFWASNSGGLFDESGYSRPLNSYLYPARIPQPPGYVSTGSGSTWTFRHGTPTPAQRASLQVEVCRSPGDVATRQRNWPAPTPGISGYDDVGTSYMLNMRWFSLLPGSFTERYNEGLRRIGLAFDGANPSYIWIADQTADYVTNVSSASIPGEFGKINASVCGFADGTVRYMRLTPAVLSGPGYTFVP